ncbi:MAG: hypothetical protein KF900_00590 [Bacteroidetes bacterium]|nr:hypothetical protein [Bacteroidota bacterium]
MSNSGKAFLVGLCSALAYFIILIACFYYELSGDFLILFLVIPVIQFFIGYNLKSSGKKELGAAILQSIVVEVIILVVIIFFLNVYK